MYVWILGLFMCSLKIDPGSSKQSGRTDSVDLSKLIYQSNLLVRGMWKNS